jgi:hypothetical protein
MKLSDKILATQKRQAAKQAKLNEAQQAQENLLNLPLESHTQQSFEALTSESYRKLIGLHGQTAIDAKLAEFPQVRGVRRAEMVDPTVPVRTRDVQARMISREQQELINDAIRKAKSAEIEEGARILSAKEANRESLRIIELLNEQYPADSFLAPILAEAIYMTPERYEELGKFSAEDVSHMRDFARLSAQGSYPVGNESPEGWDGKKLTDDEAEKIVRFCVAQDPAIDFTDPGNWYVVYTLLKCERVIRVPEVPKVVMQLDLEEEPTPVATEETNPFKAGSREAERWDHRAAEHGNLVEYDQRIGPFLQEISDESRKQIPYTITQEVIAELEKRRQAPTRENVRRIFYFKYADQHTFPNPFTGPEVAQWERERAENQMTASEYARSIGQGNPSIWAQR